jgi:hypothetical protein
MVAVLPIVLLLGLAEAKTPEPVMVVAVSLSAGLSFYGSAPNEWSESRWQASSRQSEIRLTRQGSLVVVGVAVHRVDYPADTEAWAVGGGLVLGVRHPLATWLDVRRAGPDPWFTATTLAVGDVVRRH